MAKTKLNTVTGQEDVLNQNLPIDIETDPPKKENGKKSKNNTKSLKNLINADYEKLSTEGVYDYQDLIKPTTAPIKTVEGVFPRLPKDYFEPYEDYINPTVLKSGNNTIEELQKLRALNQSNWQQFGNAMGRLATNIIPQIIGGFSSMVDLPGYWDAEHAANNSLVNWAADVKEQSEEWFPIYEEAPGESMQMGDFAWWATRGEGLVESIGAFLAQGAGAAKLASWGLKGTAALIRAKNLTRAIAGAEKSKRILQGSSALTTATMLNQSEAVLEATQVYRDIYQDRLDKGYNQDEARKAAASAAATTISINRINILLNLTSASAFLQPMKLHRKFLKAPTKARTFRRLGLEAGQEGAEELINLAAEKAGRAKGIGEKYTFQNALKDIKTMEGFEAAFLGAIGGIAQTGGQIALSHSKYGPGAIKDADGNRISAAQQTKDRYKAQQEAIEELQSKGVNLSEALFGVKEAIQFQNDLEEAQLILADPSKSPEAKAEAEKKIEGLKTRMFENQSLKAFKTGTTETLINLYKSIAEGDPIEMEAIYGKDYKEKVAQAIADIENLENVYENYEDYANVDEIFYNRANKIRAERIRGYYEGLHEDADLDLRNQLSEISKKYKFKNERTVTIKRNGKETTETVTDESPLYFKSDNIEENQGDTEENKKIYDEFLKEVQETGAYKKEKRYKELLNENQQLQNDNQENFNEITSSKYQKEFAKKKQEEREKLETLKEINTTKSIADLEKMRAEYSENEEVKKAIDKRIEAVKLAQAKEAKIKKNNVIKQNITSKITNAKDTDTLDKVRAELGKTDLSKEEKTELSNLINAKATELAGGGPVVRGTAPASSAANSNINNTEENSDINRHKDAPDYESNSEEAGRLEDESKRTAADIAEDGKRSGVDEEGKVYHYERSQAGEGAGLAASLSRGYTQTDDSTNVTREDIDNDIIGSDLNKLLLNPNNLNPGVKITFKVNEDYSGEIYKSDSTKKETIQWQARLKQLKEKYGDDYKNSSEYINEVPIVALDSNEQEVFYMHATSWINPENLEGTPENLKIDRENLVALRSEVIGKGELKSEITSRSSGVLMRTKNNENISLAEAMPDEDLVLGIGEKDDSNIYHTNGKPIEGDIINKQDPRNGALYAIVRISKGKSIAVPVSRQSISEKVADTIYNAIVAHLTGDTKNPVVQAVYEATGGSRGGIDITTAEGLRKYLKQFIYLFPTEGQAGLETILANKTSSFSSENGIITVTPNGIEFGRPGIQMGQNTFARVVSPHFAENQNTQGLLALRSFLFNTDTQTSYLKTNADKESLKNNGPVIFVDAEGNTTTTATYTEFLKGQFQTNIFSANIGTEENPNWIYTIQPKITFDTSAVKTEEVTVPPKPKAAPEGLKKRPLKSTKPAKTGEKVIVYFDKDNVAHKTDASNREQAPFTIELREDGTAEISIINNAGTAMSVPHIYIAPLFNQYDDMSGDNLTIIEPSILRKEGDGWALVKEGKIASTPKGIESAQADLREETEETEETKETKETEGIVVKRGKNSYTVTPEGVVISGATGKPLDNQESNFAKQIKKKAEETKETTTVLPEGPEIVIEEEEAAAIHAANTLTSEQITGILENIEQGTDINDPVTGTKIEGEALTEFQNILRRAQEIQAENAPKKVFVPGIGWVDITKDDESDDGGEYTDEFVPEIEDLKGALKEEAEVLIIDGINSEEQHSLIGWITQGIVEDKEGKKTAFDKKKKTLIALEKAYRDAGLVNKANRVKKILDQFDKVKSLTNEYLATIETGRVQEASAEENEAAIVRKDFGDDFSVTLDSKGTASANLRKFFGFVTLTENGEEVKNSLGLPVVEDFDTIYNTLHEILANLPADLDMMIKVMESYKDTFPWLQDIITKIQKADESVQNEFVSDMAKHAITMRFLLWKKNKNGGYRLMDMNANSSSIKKRLLNIWKSNLKGATEGIYTEGTGSNLVTIDAETGEYIYNQEEVERLMAQAKEWYELSSEEKAQIPVEDLAMWLGNFGIVLSDKTYEDLKDGKFYNNGIIAYSSLFTNEKGLVRVLAQSLYAINSSKPSLSEKNILKDSVINSIASIEAKNSLNIYSNSFNAGGKTIYTYTNNKYLVNRVRDLLAADEALIKKLKQIDFTKDSLWIEDLLSENEQIAQSLRDRLGVDYLSLEALKEMFTKPMDNRKLNNLTAAEQEVIKIGLFQSQSYNKNIDGTNKRKVSFFYPTMSDKSTMMIINTMSYDLGMEDIANGMMSTESAELLYKALILPEINRMAGAKRNSNIAGYEPDYFYFLPELNDVMVSHPTAGNKLLKDLAIDGLATDPAVQEQLITKIKSIFQGLVHDKLGDWDALGIGVSNKKGIYSLLDFKYMNNNAMGLGEDKRAYAAADFVFNSLIANAEMFKLFIGDPAQYAKNITTNEDGTVNLEETFVNIGKRLAGDIAPGLELANSEKNSYYQILLDDSTLESKNIEYLERLVKRGVLSKEDLEAYKRIDTTDAQEYTTWQEHLYVMKQLGRLTTKQYKDISSKLKKGEKLSDSELGIVLQPMKPVYVGNQVEVGNNLDRRIYIKSSSFPLLPQLTKGLEIDKVRQLLEDFQESKKKEKTADGSPPTVRASFGTANKVGGIKNGVKIFDKDGNVNDNIEIADDQFLILSRKNFRIQQDVPYKETKAAVNIGTQERKLLFLNMLDVSGFTYEGEEHTGQKLNDIYTELYKELFEHKQKQFAKEFGIDLEGELSVPAKKIQAILTSEIKRREGYPLNMLSSLELNEEGTDFKIPLWASPYSAKFESLLISAVNNSVVKGEFPGHSYVLGSEEGFKVKEGVDAEAELKKSGIVFTKNYDPEKGLQPMRVDSEGNILPAQIMVPFKFRDDAGNLLDAKDFIGKDGKIDFNKMDEKTMKLFGFRIPTQGINSMAAIEVVGFLPKDSGDLVLAPRDFIAQMGSDFDVDKLFTYMYNIQYVEGKLTTDLEDSEENYITHRQNKILDIHLSILGNNNDEVLRAIFKPDSTGDLKEIANRVEKIKEEKTVTILSDIYQRTRFLNATAGKAGTGVFSLDSTFNAAAQGKELVFFMNEDENPRELSYEELLSKNKFKIKFGAAVSRGDLSNKYTLRGEKLKSEIITALQSASVDNEKEQILDKLNINDETFEVVKALALLGFDSTDIAGLLTQPIIWEYVKRVKEKRSSLTEFTPDAEREARRELREEWDVSKRYIELISNEELRKELKKRVDVSGEELLKMNEEYNLEDPKGASDTSDYVLMQILLLEKFVELKSVGKHIRGLQSAINTDSAGIPNTLLAVSNKVEQIQKMQTSLIANATDLLGSFQINTNHKSLPFSTGTPQLTAPSTISGFASYYGTMLADRIYASYFPYKEHGFQIQTKAIINHLKEEESDISPVKMLAIKKKVFENMKAFLFSDINLGIFTENVQIERKRLFIDTDTNKSLATILNELSSKGWFSRNQFLNKLSWDLNKDGNISRINYEAASGENLDERPIYTAFQKLLNDNVSIGTFNGHEYTTRTLAQDLILYAFLEGGSQKAKQFLKYVPTSYLKYTNFGATLSEVMFSYEKTFGGTIMGATPEYTLPSRFTRQYFQNNPAAAKEVTVADMSIKGKINVKSIKEFRLSVDGMTKFLVQQNKDDGRKTYTHFVSLYDAEIPSKYALFEYDVTTNTYKRIPTLSDQFGFTQYDKSGEINIPIQRKNDFSGKKIVYENDPKNVKPDPNNVGTLEVTEEGFKINNANNSKDTRIEKLGDLVINRKLKGRAFLENLLDQLELSDNVSLYNKALIEEFRKLDLPGNFNVKIINIEGGEDAAAASWKNSTGTLTLNKAKINKKTLNDIGIVILHELTHTYTVSPLNNWINKKYSNNTAEQNKIISRLDGLKRKYIQQLLKDGDKEGFILFYQGYMKMKLANKDITKKEYDKRIKDIPGIGKVDEFLADPEKWNITREQISKFYGAINVKEFVAMALTDPEFQKKLNTIEDKSKDPFWSQIVKLLSDLLKSIGIDVKPDTVLANSLEDIMSLINVSNNTIRPAFQEGPAPEFVDNPNVPFKVGDIVEYKGEQGTVERVRTDIVNGIGVRLPDGNLRDIKPGNLTFINSTPTAPTPTQPTSEVDYSKYKDKKWGTTSAIGRKLKLLKHLEAHEKNNNKKTQDQLVSDVLTYIEGYSNKDINTHPLIDEIKEAIGVLKKDNYSFKFYESKGLFYIETPNGDYYNNRPTQQTSEVKVLSKNIPIAQVAAGNKSGGDINDLTEANKDLNDLNDNLLERLMDYGFGKNNMLVEIPTNMVKGGTRVILGKKEDYLVEAFKKEGQINPILLDKNFNIIEGKHRLFAAKKLGLPIKAYMPTQPAAEVTPTAEVKKVWDKILKNIKDNIESPLFKTWFEPIKPIKLKENVLTIEVPSGFFKEWLEEYYIKLLEKVGKEQNVTIKINSVDGFTEPAAEETSPKDKKYELFPGVYANEKQREAIDKMRAFIESNDVQDESFVLMGRGGTGKTTIVKKIIADAKRKGKRIIGAAQSHPAKRVLKKSLEGTDVEAITLARLLAIKLNENTGKFTPDEYKRRRGEFPAPKYDLIIIDEASMLSDKMLNEILALKKKGAKVIFMGDNAQLPPIGQDKDSSSFTTNKNPNNKVTLEERMRQGEESPIVPVTDIVANNIENGNKTGQYNLNPIKSELRITKFDEDTNEGVIFSDSEEDALSKAVEDFKNTKDDPNGTKLVTFNNERHSSPQSVKNLNNKIRQKLLGEKAKNKFNVGEIITGYDGYLGDENGLFDLGRGHGTYKAFTGDQYIIENGENLIIEKIEPTVLKGTISVKSIKAGIRTLSFNYQGYILTVKKGDGGVVKIPVVDDPRYEKDKATLNATATKDIQLLIALNQNFANVQYGYAVTSHKAQGSTYRNTYVFEDNIMGNTNRSTPKAKNQSLYVALSRPSKKLVVVSNKNTGKKEEVTVRAESNIGGLFDSPYLETTKPPLPDLDDDPNRYDQEPNYFLPSREELENFKRNCG